MRIKRLDICGFKSFMDRVVFQFDDGITGVVGPNGCGKSNVVDSIRWVMGEQSAKNLRGHNMQDIIFNGSESQAPLSMAEVTIAFYNDTPALLPPQYQGFPEIAVTRRLFRSGESEYLINKTACRLLDITELFLGTGVGTRAYSIIEQGRIGLIVSAKPEDRRSLIEEAAGITRYKARRKAAERKMEYTEQNLLRVGDITSELGKRLDSLNRQAKKAEKYRRVKAEMREIELHSAAHRYLELTALEKSVKSVMEGLSGEEKELADRVLASETEIEALRAGQNESERALSGLNEKAHRIDNALKVGEANLESYGRELDETRRRISEGERELEEIRRALAGAVEEKAALDAELVSLFGLRGEDGQRLDVVQREISQLAMEEIAAAKSLETERAGLVGVLSRIATSRSNIDNLSRSRGDMESRLHANQAERDELHTRAVELERARTDFVGKLGSSRQMKLALEQRRVGEEEALSSARREFMENEAHFIAAREELADKRSRLNSLKEIEKNYEGFGRGVRAVMLKGGDKPLDAGIYGLVSDVVRAPANLEKAIEAALGERLQSVVVADREKALLLVGFLKSAREGRSAFLPLDSMSRAELTPIDANQPGVVGKAAELVTFEAQYAGLVQHLLGEVVVVKDLEAAVSYSKTGLPHTVVTLDGELIEPSGAMVGGALEGAGHGALQKRREIIELTDKLGAVETDFQVAQERHKRLSERIFAIESALKGLDKDTHSGALSVVEQEKDLHKVSEDLARARERLEKLSLEGDGLSRALAELSAEESSSTGQSAQAEGERSGRETKVRELSETLAALRVKLTDLSAEQTQLKVKVATDFERRDALEKGIARTTAMVEDLTEREERAAISLHDAATRRAELEEKIAATGKALELQTSEHDGLAAEQEEARKLWEAASARVRDEEGAMKASRKRLDELQGGLGDHALKEREYALELTYLCDTLRERHAVELSHEVSSYHHLPPPTPEMEEQLKALREQVERMGEINLTAIEEFQELSTRHEFLMKQKADLEESMVQLKKAIQRINKTSKERFKETFDIINDKFQQIFPRLFNGGRAGLVLTESDDTMEGGIEIMAQPPGKKLQSVNLLSGGEKALTAVSLIFAIFLIKPTPFCLLDEVDAPLDDANVGRYNEMVKEMAKQSQFILITHNKRTMQIADTLYGVTMEEPGISKTVSVKMSERAANQDDAPRVTLVPAAG